jgi:excisionase family DNA binding protein
MAMRTLLRRKAALSEPEGEQPVVYTVEETAALLRIGRNHAYEALKDGTIPSLRFGRRWVVPRAALERLLKNESS